MDRRTIIKAAVGATALTSIRPLHASILRQPRSVDWQALRDSVGGRLIPVQSPLEACAKAGGVGADALFKQLKNPYYLGDEVGLTQSLGWVGGWTSRPSSYAVIAENAADVAAAINFARMHKQRLVIKGGGHSYFGNSNAADSLLIWTRKMRDIVLHDDFRAVGFPPNLAPVPAVSVGAGAIWGQVYNAVAAKGGRYVQGGGCLTVGVAGFIQGGGFGSFSKAYGTGAANLLEAEIVTADGHVRIANEVTERELFFALKGGGGGTFGVVTRLTLRTHELPQTIGAILFSVVAKSDSGWRDLVSQVIRFYAEALHNPTWGEQLRFSPGRKLGVSMLFRGLTADAARAVWLPLLSWIAEHPDEYRLEGEPFVLAAPGSQFWDPAFLRSLAGVVRQDDREGASPDSLFWATNRGEAGQVLHAYRSAWMPSRLLETNQQGTLVDALVAASEAWSVSLHTNKGLAGGDPLALRRTRETATNPEVLDAFALLICAAEGPPAWPGITGHEPDVAIAKREAAAVNRAMKPIESLVPNAGSYVSEADYFQRNWKNAHWGEHYPRLAAVKRRYDPAGLFGGHHCIQSV